MNIAIFVNTPAQAHFYKNIAKSLEKKGHHVIFLARDYRETLKVLDGLNIKYFLYSTSPEQKIAKITNLPFSILKAQSYLKKNRADITLGFGGQESYTAFLLHKPSLVFIDSEPHINVYNSIQFKLFMPFVHTLITPDSFVDDLGKKQIKVKSFKEMAYLHPRYFTPNNDIFDLLQIKKNEEYVLVRFNAFDAVHDAGIEGFSIEKKRTLIKELEKHVRVFVSAEGDLPPDLEKYTLRIPKHKIHDCMYYAKMIIADTQTMITEAALLGTPAIRCNTFVGIKDMGNFTELEQKYKLIFNYQDPDQAIRKAVELLQDTNLKDTWAKRKKKFFDEKIDLSSFMVWYIENFPESFHEITKNPEIQDTFK